MNRFIYSEAGDIRHLPKTPVTSRFVSPWDTSGWYSVLPDFDAGKKVYSNCDLCVKDCPAELVGADYIMTFNSNADGFDDKQEVDFYVERDALVSVCIDTRIGEMPDFTKDFSQKEDALVLDDGTRYLVFEKKYFDGDEVHIPGISGECNHFIVAIRPAE
ncbi:MAG: hypothetical protein KBS59_03890, partial [Clostridiales bacterium]|nr:hypothetical protein [Clostridiales bacterium]